MLKVLCVCLGNICRSPMAESVLQETLEDKGYGNTVSVESAGTASYHIGEWPDPRTIEVLVKHGNNRKSKARQAVSEDFHNYDFILAMDHSNYADLEALNSGDSKAELHLFREFDSMPENKVVPDPYYGGKDGFEQVYQMVRRSSEGFVDYLESKKLI